MCMDVKLLEVGHFNGREMFNLQLYLPAEIAWKTSSPHPNTGPGRLMNEGRNNGTVLGESEASEILKQLRPGMTKISSNP